MRKSLIALLAAMLLSGGISAAREIVVDLHDETGEVVGSAVFLEEEGGVRITVELTGFTAAAGGARGIHLHETGACEPDFSAAGAHFNPEGAEHGHENPLGHHAGDLPNIEVDADGNASYEYLNEVVTLDEEEGTSLLAGDGTAIVIHFEPDDYETDPDGNAGERIACGVVAAADPPQARSSGPDGPVGLLVPAHVPVTDELLASLALPAGFSIAIFAEGLDRPRMLAQAPDGTIYVTLENLGDVGAFQTDEQGRASAMETVIDGLEGVHGIAFLEGDMYVATPTSVYVGRPDGLAPVELTELFADMPAAGQHYSRTMRFGPDGLLYINVGSSCDACVDSEPQDATIQRANADGSDRILFATGLRNSMGFDWHPVTGELWAMDHGRDWHGDDSPPEEFNRVEMLNDYGWPFCYGDRQPDLTLPMEPTGATFEEYCALTEPPVLEYQAHSSPISLSFYTGDMFPDEYRNDAFLTLRGSWNRDPAVGYKLVRITFDEEGQPTEFEDFITGFLLDGGQEQFGRPAGLLVLQDGSLLFTDDTGGVIYRVTYEGEE